MSDTIATPYDIFDRNLLTDLFDQYRARQPFYVKYDRYVAGAHDLRFATERWENTFGHLFRQMTDNYCGRVVSTLAERLTIDRFAFDNETTQTNFDAWSTSQRLTSHMKRLHRDAFKYGAGYAILAPNGDGDLTFYRQRARDVAVLYDTTNISQIALALKIWWELDGRWRLNIYLPEGVHRFVGQTQKRQQRSLPNNLASFKPIDQVDATEPAFEAYPLPGRLPVFAFANDPNDDDWGVSELADVIPLQDALNKTLCDMMVGLEFQAFAQRWATGIEVEKDETTGEYKLPFKVGIDRLMTSSAPDAKFGEFGQANLDQILHVAESLRCEIARVKCIPLHYLMMSDQFPSGEALKVAEKPLNTKVGDRRDDWGVDWMAIAQYWADYNHQPVKTIDLEWCDVSPRSEVEAATAEKTAAEAAIAKQDAGFSKATTIRELGGDPELEADQRAAEKAADPPAPNPFDVMVK